MVQIKVKKSMPLKELTTFKVGGLATYYIEVKDKEELTKAINFAREKSLEVFMLGSGSNILFSDSGFKGLVIKYIAKRITFEDKKHYSFVNADAGVNWDDLVVKTVNKRLQGIECLSGIPGNVGAAPIQNIGAYGQELRDVFMELTAYDFRKKRFIKFDRADCKFAYRDSVFKNKANRGRFMISEITIKLNKDSPPQITYQSLINYLKEKNNPQPSLSEAREAVLTIRGRKLENPNVIGNAGSFFKNPVVEKKVLKELQKKYPEIQYYPENIRKVKLLAGWLIENAGWKGKKYKNAQVSEKHALVITNPGGKASAQDVIELAKKISDDVYKKFKVKLEPEVQFIGFN